MANGLDVYARYRHEDEWGDLDAEGAAARLAAALRLPTVSQCEGDAPFLGLHRLLRDAFPRVAARASFEGLGRDLLVSMPGTDAALPPALLLAHQDVVGIAPGTEGDWAHGPFEGFLDDTHVWGRGALDMKSTLMGYFEALELLLARGLVPRRGVMLALGSDEETASLGATRLAALLEERGERFAFSLDEGTTTLSDAAPWGAPGTVIQELCVTQKGYLDLVVSSTGVPGHSSNPFGGTALERVARALAALSEAQPAPRLTPPVAQTLRLLAPHMTDPDLSAWAGEPEAHAGELARRLAAVRELYPHVQTTMAQTMLAGSSPSANVLPAHVVATVNFRLLPGDTPEGVLAWARGAVAGTGCSVELGHYTPAGRMDAPDHPAYQALAESLGHFYGDVLVVPGMVCAGTDSVRYERVCPECLRVLAFAPTPEEEATGVHGTDERISRRTYAQGVRVLARFLAATCFGATAGEVPVP